MMTHLVFNCIVTTSVSCTIEERRGCQISARRWYGFTVSTTTKVPMWRILSISHIFDLEALRSVILIVLRVSVSPCIVGQMIDQSVDSALFSTLDYKGII